MAKIKSAKMNIMLFFRSALVTYFIDFFAKYYSCEQIDISFSFPVK